MRSVNEVSFGSESRFRVTVMAHFLVHSMLGAEFIFAWMRAILGSYSGNSGSVWFGNRIQAPPYFARRAGTTPYRVLGRRLRELLHSPALAP